MANPVKTGDVEKRWRPLSEAERGLVKYLLADAWQVLLARVTDLDARVTAGTLDEGLVVAVESAMVLRVMRNPDGYRSETVGALAWTRDNAVSAGLLYALDDELALLSPAGALSGAFSITPYGPTYVAAVGTSELTDWEIDL